MFTERVERLKSFLTKTIDPMSQRKIGVYCYKKFGMPLSTCLKMTMRLDFDSATEDDIYMIADGLDHVLGTCFLSELFTEKEIEAKKNLTYIIKKDILPIKIKAIPLSDREWIGRINVEDLLTLINEKYIYHNAREMANYLGKKWKEVSYDRLEKNTIRVINLIEGKELIPPMLSFNSETMEVEYDGQDLIIRSLDRLFISDGIEYIAAIKKLPEEILKGLVFPVRITKFDFATESRYIRQEMYRQLSGIKEFSDGQKTL